MLNAPPPQGVLDKLPHPGRLTVANDYRDLRQPKLRGPRLATPLYTIKVYGGVSYWQPCYTDV